jgi:hypothetical protein
MVLSMRGSGRMIEPMARGDLFIQMEMCMKETGLMIRQMAMGFTPIKMALNTRDTGRKTSSMERERKPGLMGLFIRAIMSLGRSMA